MNKLSIAFITYNRSAELIRAINSCVGKGIDDVTFAIWDNHSDSSCSRNLREFIDSSTLNCKYHYCCENLGVAGGRNGVWNMCNTEYVLFLDDDAVLESKNFLSEIVEFMDSHLDVGAAGVNIFEPLSGKNLNCSRHHVSKDGLNEVPNFVGACHIIRKSSILRNKLYPESFKYGSEEMYLGLNLWDSNFRVVEISSLTAYHMPSNVNRCAGKERFMNLVVNQFVIKKMLYPRPLITLCYIVFVLRLVKNKLSIHSGLLLSKQRNENGSTRIKYSTIIGLIKKFGFLSFV